MSAEEQSQERWEEYVTHTVEDADEDWLLMGGDE